MLEGLDIIGDIHGQSEMLKALLQKLGYSLDGYNSSSPNRKLVFCGDLVDRGPGNLEVIEIVKDLVDNDQALLALGNHEFNAISFHTPHNPDLEWENTPPTPWLREHSPSKIRQHLHTLREVKANPQRALELFEWLKKQSLWVEFPEVRIIHACWDAAKVQWILDQQLPTELGFGATGVQFDEDFIQYSYGDWSFSQNTPEFQAIECLLKGPEIDLPPGIFYLDKEGTRRTRTRVKWWVGPEDLSSKPSYAEIALVPKSTLEQLKNIPLSPDFVNCLQGYSRSDKPVFVGHYWQSRQQAEFANNVFCTDWSAAKGGELCAYRWDGEQTLSRKKCVTVDSK